MNWARTNRFLAGLLGVLVVGAGVLGYLISTSYARFSEISATYDQQAAELQRLQKLAPYPEEASRKSYEEQKKQYAEAVVNLQRQLSTDSPAPENVGATEFQTRLRDAVAGVVAQARQNNVTLPADFYLGFEQYRASVPTAAAAPLLAMQLKAYDQIARLLIAQRVDAISVFKRAPLPQESGAAEPAAQPPPAASGGGAAKGGPGAGRGGTAPSLPLVTVYPLEIEFRASPSPFRAVIDEVVKARPFYVLRALRVKNERDKGPLRGALAGGPTDAAGTTPNVPPAATPAPPTAGAGRAPIGARLPGLPEPPLPDRPTLRYVVGTEHLEAAVRLEMVRFSPPQ